MVSQQQLESALQTLLGQLTERINEESHNLEAAIQDIRTDLEQRLDNLEQHVDQAPPHPPALYACTVQKVAFPDLSAARAFFGIDPAANFPADTDIRPFATLDEARAACAAPYLQLPPAAPLPANEVPPPPPDPPLPPPGNQPLVAPPPGAPAPHDLAEFPADYHGNVFVLDAASQHGLTYVSELPGYELAHFSRSDATREKIEAAHHYTVAAHLSSAIDHLAQVEGFLANSPEARLLLQDAGAAIARASHVSRGRYDILRIAAAAPSPSRQDALRVATARIFPPASAALTSEGATLHRAMAERSVAELATSLGRGGRGGGGRGGGAGGRGGAAGRGTPPRR